MRGKPKVRISHGMRDPQAMAVFVSLFALLGCIAMFTTHAAAPTASLELESGTIGSPSTKIADSTASGGSAIQFGVKPPPPPTCTVSAQLVNSCRPWIGAATGGYSMVTSDAPSQFGFFEKRLNDPNVLNSPASSPTLTYKLDIVHTYHGVGSNSLSSTDLTYAQRANTFLLTNWKPAALWSDAAGGNSTVNGTIKQMADSIKAIAPTKIMLTVYHEPENDVSSGNCTTNANGASAGSPTDYVNMWQNVHNIFASEGVTNVVWVMNYMGYSNWDCLVPLMWPGNSNVDWVTWDNYGSSSTLFSASIQHFYNLLTTDTDANHAFTSKIWGLSELGYGNSGGHSTQPNAIAYWNDALSAIQNNSFPRLHMYTVFDTSGNGGTSQVGLNFSGAVDTTEQAAYNVFAQAVINTGQ